MTLKELSQLYYLKNEIKRDQMRLDELRFKSITASSPNVSKTWVKGSASKIERYTEDIEDLAAIISAKQKQCIYEYKRLERYIQDISDSLLRQIFTLRFIDGMKWNDVADNVGGYNTSGSVRMMCTRYLEKN